MSCGFRSNSRSAARRKCGRKTQTATGGLFQSPTNEMGGLEKAKISSSVCLQCSLTACLPFSSHPKPKELRATQTLGTLLQLGKRSLAFEDQDRMTAEIWATYKLPSPFPQWQKRDHKKPSFLMGFYCPAGPHFPPRHTQRD